jgi:hypothetical protein
MISRAAMAALMVVVLTGTAMPADLIGRSRDPQLLMQKAWSASHRG